MLQIYSNFFTDDEFQRIIGTLDRNNLHDVPNAVNTKSCPSRVFRVKDKISRFGDVSFQEILVYSEGGYSNPHIDGMSYGGGLSWKVTGILICNEEYTGGELYFPKLEASFKLPKNTLVIFPAGVDSHQFEHGVSPVLSGERITAIFRFI